MGQRLLMMDDYITFEDHMYDESLNIDEQQLLNHFKIKI